MLSATRVRTVRLGLVLLVASAVVAFTGYRLRDTALLAWLQEPERRVVGLWKWTVSDAEGRMRIFADHRVEHWFVDQKSDEDHPDPRDVIHGRWSIQGSDFVHINDPGQIDGGLAVEEHRIPISHFGNGMWRVR